MMTGDFRVLFLHDSEGLLQAVQLSPDLWQKLEPHARKFLDSSVPVKNVNDLQAFSEFIRFWDFSYAYTPDVECPHCGNSTSDWQTDPEKSFQLTNANIGGLLVFHCQKCGATVRQKYFRDHRAVEFSP